MMAGCTVHGVDADNVARWWKTAEAKDATVAVCACCESPAAAAFIKAADGNSVGITTHCRYCEAR